MSVSGSIGTDTTENPWFSVPVPKQNTKTCSLKNTLFVSKNKMYKNQCQSFCLFKIVFQVFPQVIEVWKTVNKFHPNLISLLINEM